MKKIEIEGRLSNCKATPKVSRMIESNNHAPVPAPKANNHTYFDLSMMSLEYIDPQSLTELYGGKVKITIEQVES
jgi:hypothetical protein